MNKKHPLHLLAFFPKKKGTYTLPDASDEKRTGFAAKHVETYTFDYIFSFFPFGTRGKIGRRTASLVRTPDFPGWELQEWKEWNKWKE